MIATGAAVRRWRKARNHPAQARKKAGLQKEKSLPTSGSQITQLEPIKTGNAQSGHSPVDTILSNRL